jgi:hypothetical protein
MAHLAEIGLGIVTDDVFAKNNEHKLIRISHELGLDRPSAEAAFNVLKEAADTLKKIEGATKAL